LGLSTLDCLCKKPTVCKEKGLKPITPASCILKVFGSNEFWLTAVWIDIDIVSPTQQEVITRSRSSNIEEAFCFSSFLWLRETIGIFVDRSFLNSKGVVGVWTTNCRNWGHIVCPLDELDVPMVVDTPAEVETAPDIWDRNDGEF